MAAEVETMFYTRQTPWHGLGTKAMEAPASKEALSISGLDWKVEQEDIYTETGNPVSGFKANIRSTDRKILGVVTDRYKVVQNEEAFAFTDALLGEGVRYETAGSLQGGRKVWQNRRWMSLQRSIPRHLHLPIPRGKQAMRTWQRKR